MLVGGELAGTLGVHLGESARGWLAWVGEREGGTCPLDRRSGPVGSNDDLPGSQARELVFGDGGGWPGGVRRVLLTREIERDRCDGGSGPAAAGPRPVG